MEESSGTLASHPQAGEETRTRRALLHMLEDLQRERDAIQQARRRWLDTVDAVDSPLLVHDEEFRIVRANRAYAARAGMSFQELIGRPYGECFPRLAESHKAVPAQFELETGESFSVRSFPVGGASGQGALWLHIFDDVTNRRRTDEQARAMQEVSASEGILQGDVDGVARQMTEAAVRVTKVARANVWLFNEAEDELRCIDLYEAASGLHSAGMVLREPEFANEFRALKHAPYVDANDPLTDPRTSGYVESYVKPNGITSMLDMVVEISGKHIGLLCLEHVGRPYTWQPDEIAFAGRLADKIAVAITNRKTREAEQMLRASELRFRTIFEQAPVGISESSTTGRYLNVNERLCQITGYSAQELMSRTFRDVTHPEDLERDELKLAELLSGQAPYYSAEKRYLQKSGKTVWVSLLVTPVRDANGVIMNLLMIAEEITARKQAETEIRALARFPQENPNPIMRMTAEGRVLYANPASVPLQQVCNAAPGECAQGHCAELVRESLRSGQVRQVEMKHDDRIFSVTVAPFVEEGYANIYGLDITERRRAEEALVRRERYYRKLTEGSSDAFFIIDKEGKLLFRSESGTRLTGYETEEVLGKNLTDFVLPESLPDALRAIAEVIQHPEKQSRVELRIAHKDDSKVEVEALGRNLLGDPDVNGIIVTAHDITERKLAETRLQENRDRLALATRSARIGIWDWDVVANKLVWDTQMYDLYGIRAQDFSGAYDAWQKGLHPEDKERGDAAINGALDGVRDFDIEFRVVWPSLEVRHIEAHAMVQRASDGTAVRMIGVNWDITGRKQAERSLRDLNRALKTLSAGNVALVHASGEAGLLQEMTRILHEVGGYPLAIVAYAAEDSGESVVLKACRGIGSDAKSQPPGSWAESDNVQSAVARAVRFGETQLVRNVDLNAGQGPWGEIFRALNIAVIVGLPLRDSPGGRPFGAIGIGAAESEAFDESELKLLEELASDLAYGITNLRAGVAQRAAAEKLRRSLEGTIDTLAATMEMRDPYTAGHQRRVAEIAAAIAAEMHLPAETIQGIHFGALIHDIGKIQVPSEILSKPSRLTKLEYELIKVHAQAGYDIIKGVDFPWPVANMVRQHHERLDGSGYPQGLKGDEIALEARVLAVADVVEAMSSHRPYRAGLGMDAALKEIETKRGVWFDPAAVDACLRLFREKNFAFEAQRQ